MRIDTATADRDVDMGMLVETTTIRLDGAENADIQRTFASRVQQVIDSQAEKVVKWSAVDFKQGPE